MSGLGFGMHDEPTESGGAHGRRALAVALVVLVAIVLVVGLLLAGPVKRLFGDSGGDYSGEGTGTVLVVVHDGDSASTIGTTLASGGVVRSASRRSPAPRR